MLKSFTLKDSSSSIIHITFTGLLHIFNNYTISSHNFLCCCLATICFYFMLKNQSYFCKPTIMNASALLSLLSAQIGFCSFPLCVTESLSFPYWLKIDHQCCASVFVYRWVLLIVLPECSTVHTAQLSPWITTPFTECQSSRFVTASYYQW